MLTHAEKNEIRECAMEIERMTNPDIVRFAVDDYEDGTIKQSVKPLMEKIRKMAEHIGYTASR